MATVVAQSKYIFGLRTGVTNNLCFFDEQTVIFPCGNNCVRYNIDEKWQKFIPGTEKSQGMQALAISANRRYLAVSECGEKATITVYDLQHEQGRKRKVLSGGDIQTQEFVCMAFSPDSKYLIGQAGGPEWTLILWLWEKQKVMATVTTSDASNPVSQVSFNPFDSENPQICVSGAGVFKLFRYTERALKPSNVNFLKGDSINFLCHAWTSKERVMAGTDTGRLLVFESGDLRWEMNVADRSEAHQALYEYQRQPERTKAERDVPMSRVTAILSYSKGFICSAGPGTVCLFEKTEERDNYRRTRDIRIPSDLCSNELSQAGQQEITTMCISLSEETLAISTDHGQLYSITLSSVEMNKGEQAHFEFLSQSFHSKPITGLSICIRKPLIATSSLDHSVRIWNFETNELELCKRFQEEAYSVALHPSGLFILVGFSDKLRLMNLLIDDIRTFKEFTVRGCRECAFSHGGHMFAAVNGNIIHIYSVTSLENLVNLKGHNGKVRAVTWSLDDSRLVSCGMDGAVYEWNTLTGKRESESVLKSCSYTGVAVSSDAKTIFTVGSDQTLKEIQDCQILREVPADDVAHTAIAVSRSSRVIFTGTSSGTVRAIKYPLPLQKDWDEYQGHSGPITKMVITFDEQLLLTVSEDGCLLVWKLIDKEGRGLKRDKEIIYTEEILITKSDLEEKNQNTLELRTRVEELKMENEYQLRLKAMNYREKIKELSEKFIQEIEALKTKNQVMKTERERQGQEHQQTLAEVTEKHSKELQDLESSSNQKVVQGYEKCQELQRTSQAMQEDYERQLRAVEDSRTSALEEITHKYEVKLQEKSHLLDQCQDKVRQHVHDLEETRRQIEEDEDREIHDLCTRYNQQLLAEKEENRDLKGEAGIMKKKFQSMQREIDSRCSDIDKMRQEQQKLQAVIRSLEKDVLDLKRKISDKDNALQYKEVIIYDLDRKKKELEKLRSVMDNNMKELKKQIEPRENDIKEMKEMNLKMGEELVQFNQTNNGLERTVAELSFKLKTTDKEMHKEMRKVKDVEAHVHQFKRDLHLCVAFIQEPKKLKESICQLYKRYVEQSDVVEIVGVDADIPKGFGRQGDFQERNLASLKMKLNKDSELHRRDKVRMMQENVSLIKEINELRKELRTARAQVHELEIHMKKKARKPSSADLRAIPSAEASGSPVVRLNPEQETERIIQLQRCEMQRLQQEILNLSLGTRPLSPPRTKLPVLATKYP